MSKKEFDEELKSESLVLVKISKKEFMIETVAILRYPKNSDPLLKLFETVDFPDMPCFSTLRESWLKEKEYEVTILTRLSPAMALHLLLEKIRTKNKEINQIVTRKNAEIEKITEMIPLLSEFSSEGVYAT